MWRRCCDDDTAGFNYLVKLIFATNLTCRVELSFFAVSLNLCQCLKSCPITVEFCQAVQQNDGGKSKGSPFVYLNRYLKKAFGSP